MKIRYDVQIGCFVDANASYTPCARNKDPTAYLAIRNLNHAEKVAGLKENKHNNAPHPFTRVWRKKE